MTDYGVQPTGFVRKPLSVIKADMEAMNRAEFGSNVIQTPQSPLGQIVGILSERDIVRVVARQGAGALDLTVREAMTPKVQRFFCLRSSLSSVLS